MKKLLALHGFLGSPQDFNFLKDEYHITAPTLDELVHFNFQQLSERILPKERVDIIGYSFGGRLAARLKIAYPDIISRCFLMGAHMGLNPLTSKRIQWEKTVVEKINTLSTYDFLAFWNQLPLFYADQDLNTEVKINADYFLNYGLSKQEYLIPQLGPYSSEVFFCFGELDSKYVAYAHNELEGFNVSFIPRAGHRLVQYHQGVKEWLKSI